ncbi:MAG: family 43 glycosylhydrolase [Clostridia bacterium]|nr:family 43 glycosylhydrolase [Clostridia bacterium]
MDKYNNTYCNPIPLPDYPVGRCGIQDGAEYNWRETADPTVLYEDGKWYLYSSCGMVYWTEDFHTWQHMKMEPYDCGYAPTVVKHKGKFYLCGSLSDLFVSDSPTGPFKSMGDFRLPDGSKLLRCYDPMVFSDDDGRLYLYYSTGQPLILGAELSSDNPTQLLGVPEVMFRFNPDHIWERCGEYNEDGCICSMEGPWMYKKNGIYYLIYCAPGTEYSTYGMGAYKGTSPLGPWEYMKTSPFTLKRDGVVRGPGHGSVVEGPGNTLWAFYTTTICYLHPMERRIGFDPIYINDEGDLVCRCVTETPQWAPGVMPNPAFDNDAGLVCVTGRRVPRASSTAPGRDAVYATDEDLMSFWQPADGDEKPTLTIPLCYYGVECAAVRIIWRDVGLSLRHGNLPGPIKYTLELRDSEHDGPWVTVVDRSESEEDFIVDYRTFEPMHANEVRLTVCGAPEGIKPAVMNISVFGRWEGKKD